MSSRFVTPFVECLDDVGTTGNDTLVVQVNSPQRAPIGVIRLASEPGGPHCEALEARCRPAAFLRREVVPGILTKLLGWTGPQRLALKLCEFRGEVCERHQQGRPASGAARPAGKVAVLGYYPRFRLGGVNRDTLAVVRDAIGLTVQFTIIRNPVVIAVRFERINWRHLAIVRDAVVVTVVVGQVAFVEVVVAVAVLT